MAVTAAEFLFPAGPFKPVMLGLDDEDALRGVVQQHVAVGTQAAAVVAVDARDAAIRDYVRWKLYEHLLVQRMTGPATFTVQDDITASFGAEQVSAIRGLVTQYRAAWESALPKPVGATAAVLGMSARTIVEW